MRLTQRVKNNLIAWCLTLVFAFMSFQANASGHESGSEEKKFNLSELVFGHIGDEYSWHLWTYEGKHVAIPLLCIVKGQEGWDVFSSSHLHEGYKNYTVSEAGKYKGKIVEKVGNEEVRPLDISITKNVASLLFTAALMLIIFLTVAKSYKKDPIAAPKGLQAFMEPLILAIDEDIAKPCIGKNYKRYSPYILTAFFFILFSNYLGIIPFFPGGANVTGNIAVTFVLAFITFLMTNFTLNKHYWKDIFWPDVPLILKFPLPIMQFIEVLGMFTKPIALMFRLFANMVSGHMMQLILIGLIFAIGSVSVACGSIPLAIFMDLLEVLVCFIQAYVFAMLSSIFIGLAQPEEEEAHNK
ncbi:MAG: F0F1 ATP synthase subunit A [Paludibacteraceae bacterium]|nr:F0F1 ATP synthase subunit A [Paludibacteraceae bacterium]